MIAKAVSNADPLINITEFSSDTSPPRWTAPIFLKQGFSFFFLQFEIWPGTLKLSLQFQKPE